MVEIVNQAFNKAVGNGTLTWAELQDVEIVLNNRPLSYVEDDLQLSLLTPNMLQFGRPYLLAEPEAHHLAFNITSEMRRCNLEKVVFRVP